MNIAAEWIPVIAALIATVGGVAIAVIRTRLKPPATVGNGWGNLTDQLQEENARLRRENDDLRLANIELRRQAREAGDE